MTYLTPGFWIVFLVGIFIALASEGQDQKTQGAIPLQWAGTLNAGGAKLRLEVKLEKKKETWAGKLVSLDQGNASMSLANIKIDKQKFQFAIANVGAKFEGDIQSDGSAKGHWMQAGQKFPLRLEPSSKKSSAEKAPEEKLIEAWVGKLELGTISPVMQFRIVEKKDGKQSAYFDSVTEGRTGFAGTFSKKDNQLHFDVERIQLTYRGKINEEGDTATGTWSQGGREFPLVLKRKEEELEDKNVWENRPQVPRGPFPYESIDVKFSNSSAKVELAGTLTIPKGKGKHPVVILISGSGPQDRDETLMGHKPFLVIADFLGRQGIAVLRYDDRGTHESTGDFSTATSADLAEDVEAAMDFLAKHPRIDAAKIGLMGHSEGGLIAPIVASRRKDVAAIVMLAGPGIDGEEIILTQSRAMTEVAGIEEKEIQRMEKIQKIIISAVKSSSNEEKIEAQVKVELEKFLTNFPEDKEKEREEIRKAVEGQISRMTSPWFQYFLRHDPKPYLEKVTCPVLAVNGEKDLQVLPEVNLRRIEQALKKSGNQDFKILQLENLNHLFQTSETGSVSEYKSIQETFNPKALQLIGDWTVKRLPPVK